VRVGYSSAFNPRDVQVQPTDHRTVIPYQHDGGGPADFLSLESGQETRNIHQSIHRSNESYFFDQGINLRRFPRAFDLPNSCRNHRIFETLAEALLCRNGVYRDGVSGKSCNLEGPDR
jgi:hypothetical protein